MQKKRRNLNTILLVQAKFLGGRRGLVWFYHRSYALSLFSSLMVDNRSVITHLICLKHLLHSHFSILCSSPKFPNRFDPRSLLRTRYAASPTSLQLAFKSVAWVHLHHQGRSTWLQLRYALWLRAQ